ncbi:MAG: type II toxin-antitoxin system prevent-host-death family antitoxin [Deltaproteobacteria bacterium]
MRTMTAKDLKNHTGEVMRSIFKGEEIVVTLRGKPAAVILPFVESAKKKPLRPRPFEEAWKDIEKTLKKTGPEFKTWQEAMGWSRKRV